jgi:hypothetical protein
LYEEKSGNPVQTMKPFFFSGTLCEVCLRRLPLSLGKQGSILQNSISAENFAEKFLSSNFGQISTQKNR